MLLRHTPQEVKERSALTVNPAKTCQPIGAMYAALGVRGCLPHSHGSQGCCAYHRSALTRHYKEPVVAGTSSFTEGSAVFGGQANLLTALQNMFTIYEPDCVAVHTTCLSETIGDDLPQIIEKARMEGKVPPGKAVIYANTPSYVGCHVTGFANMVMGMAKCLAKSTGKKTGAVNILPGYVEPADMEEVKRLAREMGAPFILYPDTSGVLNGPLTGAYRMFPAAGATLADIARSGDSRHTLALGEWASTAAAQWLDAHCKVPCTVLDLPIGLAATDRFVDALRKVGGVSVPASIELERGRVVDLIADMHQYFHGKKVALVGDPDQVIALTELCLTLDMLPIHIVTGAPGKRFEERIRELTAPLGREINVRAAGDMFLLHQWIKNEKVDLLIGNTYCKYIARDEDIPLLRHGFPITDRVGHSYFPTVGYSGTLRLLVKILDLFLDRKDRDAPEESFELVH